MADVAPERIRQYLRERIRYTIGIREQEGLDAFLLRAKKRFVGLSSDRAV
jgi:hypothetical protein